jgi:hypothetical protein
VGEISAAALERKTMRNATITAMAMTTTEIVTATAKPNKTVPRTGAFKKAPEKASATSPPAAFGGRPDMSLPNYVRPLARQTKNKVPKTVGVMIDYTPISAWM